MYSGRLEFDDEIQDATGRESERGDDNDRANHRQDAELALDDNDDFGGDPYNHTGSHYIIKVDD